MKFKSIRVTREQAAQELAINARTLGGRLRQLGITTGKDSRFSLLDICRAVYWDLDKEKFEVVREQKIKLQRENAEAEKELVPVKELAQVLNRGITAIKGRIMSAANLEREDKDKICTECGELWASAFGANPADLESPATPDGK